ncbi:alpha-glucuronidase family glycosyl hydrolase [Micromonospora coerulea]|uniref:alpha-glucuronidase family glycosyl hydrolase n=1 Tax=Micromonospora coerulea TaxID=47856 RepID=UPI0019054BF2|nr:alpha-glucuronidase family glycosyl hydrolase [Micromonospora veneta]
MPGISRRALLKAGGGGVLSAYLLAAEAQTKPAYASPVADQLLLEDGYRLWLRYQPVAHRERRLEYERAFTQIVRQGDTAVLRAAESELVRGLTGLLARSVPGAAAPIRPGAVVLGTPESSPLIRSAIPADELAELGPEGYVLRRIGLGGEDVTVVASAGERGVLYGAFHLLRLLQTEQPIGRLDVRDCPASPLRLINHWDNLNRSVERGYAGRSIFNWDGLPTLDPRYTDYARALASVGINGTVVNNVNADAQFLASNRLPGLAALAGPLREWGITSYLSANYASPIILTADDADPIRTADPADARVQAWWRAKVAEIYDAIPDFGGFLVKANSEGQPGPLDYGRTHAEGANMLADLVAPHGGIVIWRSFVHEGFGDWAEYQHRVFAPLDGDFADNVAVQTKNGPIDFQVREPVNPLFGALPKTNQMIELQITQEYTGHATHLCYLVPQWKEVLDFDTRMQGEGSTVARIVDGSAYGQTNVGFAGVVNFGDDRDWTGYQLGAANTHGYARLAWNPRLDAKEIAREWVRMTFGNNDVLVAALTDVLLGSWRTYEDYTSPLGMGYLTYPLGAHFDPDPRSTLNLSHYTDATGTGFDRTAATGTGYTALYHKYWADTYESLASVPDELLLFMHKVPYTHRLQSGRTVIQHIFDSHFDGFRHALKQRETWLRMGPYVDPQRHADVRKTFDDQMAHARLWRDTVVAFFFSYSRILDERRAWLQADLGGASAVLFGGWPNRLPVEIGNATGEDLAVRSTVAVPDDHWNASPGERVIPSTEFATLKLPVQPPLTADIVTLDLAVEPTALETLGNTGKQFVVTPAGRRCLLALDAGSSSSPLVRDYQRLTPATAWDPKRGFGWVGGAPQDRDRGGAWDALRRDFCGDYPARTLRIAIPAGRHDVAVLVGDGGPDSYPTFIVADGQRVAESPQLPGGSFAWVRFSLDGGASGRTVDLTFDSVPDQFWHLCALVIVDPNSVLPPAVLTDVEADLAWLGGRPTEVAVSVANTGNDPVPVTIEIDVPDGWVSEPLSCVLPAGTEETVRVKVTPPLVPTIATVRVRVTSEAEVGDGERSLSVVAVPPGDAVPLALDAGSSASPVLATYKRLAPDDAWDPVRGYGWVGRTPDFRDRNLLDDLRRDFMLGRDAPYVLRVAVPPGVHVVHVLTGDAFAPSGTTTIRENSQNLGSSGPEIIPQGQFRWFTFSLDGGADGRTADLELVGAQRDGYWRLVALVLQPAE